MPEQLPHGLRRRVVGYFTGWRTGADGRPAYLVPGIPWHLLSHVIYAFAHVDERCRLSVATRPPRATRRRR